MISWRRYLVVGALLTAGALALPPGAGRTGANVLLGLTGVAAIVVGVRRNRPRQARAWYLMAAGVAGWVIGDGLYAWLPGATLLGAALGSFPLLSDVVYLGSYPLLGAGLLMLVRSRGPDGLTALLDAAIFTVALGLLSWVYLVEPTWAAGGAVTPELLVAVAYPLGDVLVFGILVRLATAAGTWHPSTLLLATALAATFLADAVFQAASISSWSGANPEVLDPVWTVAYVLWGAAALHPSMVSLSTLDTDRAEQMQVGRMVGLTLALVTGPGIVGLQLVRGLSPSGWSVVLASSVLAVLVLARMIHLIQLSQAQAARLGELADTDYVTGLPNRRRFVDRLGVAVAADGFDAADTPPHGRGAMVLLIDLERFSEVSDTFGHRFGDAILSAVGCRLSELTSADALVARMGDHTFGVLEPESDEKLAGRLREALRRPMELLDVSVSVEVSIGALVAGAGTDPVLALHRADVALSAAKDHPAGTALYGTELETGGSLAPLLIGELAGALENGDIVVYYQPLVEISSGRVFGVEALARWLHPRYGLLGPESFIPAAERTAMIGPFTQYMLDRALAQAARWRADGLDLKIAVNLSVRNLLDPGLVDDVRAALARHRTAPSALELEITEGSAMIDPRRSRQVLGALSALGVALSIDDYGTGYSSLAYLQRLPVSRLKIDRSFVSGIRDDAASAAIVRSTIELARNLRLDVVAEGVEDDATLLALRDMRCHAAQGFGLGRPVSGPLLPELVLRIHQRLPPILREAAYDAGR